MGAIIANLIYVSSNPQPATGTSTFVYSVGGSASIFALINVFRFRELKGIHWGYKIFWFFNILIIAFSCFDIYFQIENARSFFFQDQVNVLVHIYAFATSLMLTAIWILRNQLNNTNSFLNRVSDRIKKANLKVLFD